MLCLLYECYGKRSTNSLWKAEKQKTNTLFQFATSGFFQIDPCTFLQSSFSLYPRCNQRRYLTRLNLFADVASEKPHPRPPPRRVSVCSLFEKVNETTAKRRCACQYQLSLHWQHKERAEYTDKRRMIVDIKYWRCLQLCPSPLRYSK